MAETILEAKNLTKVFSGREVLRSCNLTVDRGMIYGLLGANGAGKTTMFKLMTGLLSPTSGVIKVQGKAISKESKNFLRNMGILIETPVFYGHLSARENLEIHLRYMGYSLEKIDCALEMAGLHDTGGQPVSQFSLGMKQRLAIARAVSHSPQILILDEPINGLDPMGIRQIRELFLSLCGDGVTIVISSHILSEVEHIADVVGVLANGAIVQEVSIQEVKKAYPDGLEDYFLAMMSGGANV